MSSERRGAIWCRGFVLMTMIALRNVRRSRRRSVLTISAIAVGVCSSMMLAALARGMQTQLVADAVRTLTGHVQISADRYIDDPAIDYRFELPSSLAQTLNLPAIKAWTTRVRVPGIILSERESAGVTLVGIVPQQERKVSFIGDAVGSGRFHDTENDEGIVVGRRLAGFLQTELGKRVVLMSQNANGRIGERGFRIVGLYDAELEATEKNYVFIGQGTAQRMLEAGESISETVILASEQSKVHDLVEQLRLHLPSGLRATTWRELEPFVVSLVEVQNKFMYFWYVIVIIAVAFGLMNTLFMGIFERLREFGLYRALGLTQGLIIMQVFIESNFLILAGIMLGDALSAAGVWLLSGGIDLSNFAAGAAMIGLSSVIYPELWLKDCWEINLLVFCLVVLSSLYPAWKGTRLIPAAAMSRQ